MANMICVASKLQIPDNLISMVFDNLLQGNQRPFCMPKKAIRVPHAKHLFSRVFPILHAVANPFLHSVKNWYILELKQKRACNLLKKCNMSAYAYCICLFHETILLPVRTLYNIKILEVQKESVFVELCRVLWLQIAYGIRKVHSAPIMFCNSAWYRTKISARLQITFTIGNPYTHQGQTNHTTCRPI